jgi:predicted acylesterase/phospholipase RssA
MSIPKIRLAFQGGGAKLAAMLPVADAFLACHERDISISRVSGTSAGAICAALVAAQADFEEVRAHLVDRGPGHFAKLVPASIASLRSKMGDGGALGWRHILLHPGLVHSVVVRGRPILNGDELHEFVAGLFGLPATSNVETVEQCGIQLAITASDIVNSRGVTHEKGNLVNAVEDSCALPILLRSFSDLNETHYVDGGLCDNLPVETLKGAHQEPIFAVYPKQEERPLRIGNIFNYLVSLLSASIGHSVSRSVRMVSPPFRFPVDSELGLLDFEKAIAQLRDAAWYRERKNEAIRRIKDFSRSYGQALSPEEARVIDIIDVQQYQRALSDLTSDSKGWLRSISGKFIVRINSDDICPPGRASPSRQADTIIRMSSFEAIKSGVRYYRTTVMTDSDNVVPTIWSARNDTTGLVIPIRALPLGVTQTRGANVRECLIEFLDARRHISKGNVIEIQSVYHSSTGQDMGKVNQKQSDFLGFTNVQGGPLLEAELQLIYPKRLGRVQLALDPARSSGLTSSPSAIRFDPEDLAHVGVSNDIVGLTLSDMPDGATFMAQTIPS